MNIQPLSSRPREISVTEAIEPALDRVKVMLFKPFDFTKWIVIGFCAWLAGLGESGGAGFNGYTGSPHSGGNAQPGEQIRHFCHQAGDYVRANLDWMVPLAAFLALAVLAVWLVLLWLNCRGKFMFLHCVVCDRAEVEAPWRNYAAAGNSLFRFRIVLGVAAMLLMLPLLGFLVADILRMVLREEADLPGVLLAVGLGLAFMLFTIVCAIIHRFIVDFIIPLMYLRGGTCLAAWREFLGLLGARPGQFVIYLLFLIVLHIVISILVITAFLVTCCIACCLVLIPFLGTVLLLPILIFKRAFSLYFLAQFGPQYDVFLPPTAPSPPTAPPA
jgi:hypothetical protein